MTVVPVDTSAVCPDCGSPIVHHVVDESALIRHAGYGATRTTVHRWCATCGWHLTPEIGETKP